MIRLWFLKQFNGTEIACLKYARIYISLIFFLFIFKILCNLSEFRINIWIFMKSDLFRISDF